MFTVNHGIHGEKYHFSRSMFRTASGASGSEVLTSQDLDAVADVARESGAYVLSDEIYSRLRGLISENHGKTMEKYGTCLWPLFGAPDHMDHMET